jgi:DNA/RNA-binding domain of Phe-tRNA-synthetase-like protein
VSAETEVRAASVSPALRSEFPGLSLHYSLIHVEPGRSGPGVRRHLRYLSDRMHGRRALSLRQEPIASAYRIFFRQIGLDPDQHRVPIEAVVLERLRAGGFKSEGVVDDAVTIAIVETGVAVRALDADRLDGQLELRVASPGERLAGVELPDGTILIADARAPVALIFGDTDPARDVTRATRRVAMCAIAVPGVPMISIEESIWTCAGVLTGEGRFDEGRGSEADGRGIEPSG